MSCLGERLTALVDGELGHEERDRVLAHLACCDRCRNEVASLRRLKGRLRGLSDTPATDGTGDLPSPDLLTRLRSLPASGDDVPPEPAPGPPAVPAARRPARPLRTPSHPGRSGGRGGSSPRKDVGRAGGVRGSSSHGEPVRMSSVGRPRDNRPAGGAAALHVHPRRRYLVVGAATLFLGLGAASYVAGGRQEAPAVTPAFDRFAVEHALTSGDAPMTDPLTDPLNQVQVTPGP